MARGDSFAVSAFSWIAWILDFCGWVIFLGGLSGMQRSCGSASANFLLSGGSAGYNGSSACDTFFSYAWWILFYNIFVWVLVAITLATRGLPRFRPALIALMAISIMQSMETANTYLSYNYLPTTSGAFRARSRTTTAGAIIKAVAQIFLVAIIGVRDESITVYEKETRAKGGPKAPGAPSPPQGAMETTPETVGVRPGRIAPPPTTTSVSPV